MKSIAEITAERTFVIAEIGQNHQGSFELAKRLIETAKLCGADAVKSQKRDIETLLTPEQYNMPYLGHNSFGRTYGEHRQALELSPEEHLELKRFSDALDIVYFASPWDIPSAQVLEQIGISIYKVASACLTNQHLLNILKTFKKPLILSTGMSDLKQIEKAIELVEPSEYYLLQCTSGYPVDFEDIHLNVITDWTKRFGCPIGLSGHHRGIAVDIAAVAIGARIIERHFTLDRTMKGTDHAVSLEPEGLRRLVRDIRAVEKAMGSSEKRVLDCESESLKKLRNSTQMESVSRG